MVKVIAFVMILPGVFLGFSSGAVFAGIKTPVNQASGVWKDFLPDLQKGIDNLESVRKPDAPPTKRAHVRVMTLSLPRRKKLYSPTGKFVHELKLIDYAYPPRSKGEGKRNGWMYVLLKHKSGHKLYKCPVSDSEKWVKARNVWPRYGATQDNVFYTPMMGHSPVLIDESELGRVKKIVKEAKIHPVMSEKTYFAKEKAKMFYEWHRPIVSDILLNAVKSLPNLHKVAKQRGVFLFALGTGSGDDLDIVDKALEKEGIRSRSYGIEIYKCLIKEGKKKYPHLHFIQGDAASPAEIIIKTKKEAIKKAKKTAMRKPTIVVAEGFLTRQVLSGAQEGLEVLQELIQDGVADVVVISGLAAPLVNEHIARAAGWEATPLMIHYPDNFAGLNTTAEYNPALVLNRPSESDYLDGLVEDFEKSLEDDPEGVIDLSMSAKPWLLLKHIRKKLGDINQVCKIDLSFSYMPREQYSAKLDSIIKNLGSFSGLQQVILSGREHWYKAFAKKIRRHKSVRNFEIALRKDIGYENELPVLNAELRSVLLGKRHPEVRVPSS